MATDLNLMDCDVLLEDYINNEDQCWPQKSSPTVRKLHDGNVNNTSSDEDNDASPPVSCVTVLCTLDVLKDFVVDCGLPTEYVAHLDVLQREVVMCANNQKQAKVTRYFQ